jgi:protein TonB
MKKALFSIGFALLIAIQAAAQNQVKTDSTQNQEPTFTYVEQMPEYPGGQNELNNFLIKNLRYPKQAMKDKTEAKAYFRFIVNEDGNIEHIESMRPVGLEFEQEGIRVIKSMPKWKPGKQNGRAVKVFFTLPIQFRLN